jgi:alkaline phosphatase
VAASRYLTNSRLYIIGKGSGLSFQELESFGLVTTSSPLLQDPEPGNHYGPPHTLLEGRTDDHFDRQSTLWMNECGFAHEFNPLDVLDGGNMVLWNNDLGGEFPWDERYYQEDPDTTTFDPTYIMQHAIDSANSAGNYATGHKSAVNQLSQDLYENDRPTLIEEAMKCGMAGGVVTSVPMFHATPGAFILHSNNRSNRDQLRTSWKSVNPTMVSGVCGGEYYPYEEDLQSMRDGPLSSQWTLLEQDDTTLAEVRAKLFFCRCQSNQESVLSQK